MIKHDIERMPDPTASAQGVFQIFDPLVGAYDRSYLPNVVSAVSIRQQTGDSISCLMIALDGLDTINDSYGQNGEAAAIRAVAAIASSAGGASSYLVRYRRDILCLILPAVGLSSAINIAQRIRHQTAIERMMVHGQPMMITASIGAASTSDRTEVESFALLHAAEAALEAACKRSNTVDSAMVAA